MARVMQAVRVGWGARAVGMTWTRGTVDRPLVPERSAAAPVAVVTMAMHIAPMVRTVDRVGGGRGGMAVVAVRWRPRRP